MFKNVDLFLILLVFSFFMHQKFSYGMKREDKVAWQHTHLSRQPKSAVEQSFIHQVRSLMAQHKLHEAKKIGKQMMKSNPTLVEGYYYTALAQFEQEEPENVEKMLSSLKKAEKNLQTAFTMALNDSSHASRETDVITQSMVQEAHQVVCQKKQYFCHLLNAKQAAEKGLRGKQSEECLQAWKTCPTHIETDSIHFLNSSFLLNETIDMTIDLNTDKLFPIFI